MQTIIIKRNELNHRFDETNEILNSGGLIAFPTETVYGIGANIYDEIAVRKVFDVKGRDYDNPMAAHISSKDQIDLLACEISEIAMRAIERLMPGPISIILKKKQIISDLVTAGRPTLAFRFPDCETAIKLISSFGSPLAATSANLTGQPSATSAGDVERVFGGKIDAIVEDGQTQIGKESTVISFATAEPTVFRIGAVSPEEIEDVIERQVVIIQNVKKK